METFIFVGIQNATKGVCYTDLSFTLVVLRILLREDKKKETYLQNYTCNMTRQTFEYGAETQARPADEQQRCHLMLDCAAISPRRRLFDHG